eukprot:2212298-Rhodomonas_salina.1
MEGRRGRERGRRRRKRGRRERGRRRRERRTMRGRKWTLWTRSLGLYMMRGRRTRRRTFNILPALPKNTKDPTSNFVGFDLKTPKFLPQSSWDST